MRKKLFVTVIVLLLSLPVFYISTAQGATRPRVDWAVLVSGTDVFPRVPGPAAKTREPLRNCYYMLHILVDDWGLPRDHIKWLDIRPDLAESTIPPGEGLVPPGTIDAWCDIGNVTSIINDWLKPNCESTDNVLIFISSHGGGWDAETGELSESGRVDTDGDEEGDGVDESIVFMENVGIIPTQVWYDDDFNDTLEDSSYNRLVIVLTSCFAGGFIDDLSAMNRIIITASDETHTITPSGTEEEPGFTWFTWAFMDALHGYNVTWDMEDVNNRLVHESEISVLDWDCNGIISWREAYIYAKDKYGIGWFDGNGNRMPTYKDGMNYLEYSLFIWHSGGGYTVPSRGEHEYLAGTTVSVLAVPYNNYEFDHWFPDDLSRFHIMFSIYPTENPYDQLMGHDRALKAYFHLIGTGYPGGGDTCPKLYTWNGNGYVDYGVIDIHNPSGEDVVREVPIAKEDLAIESFKAKLRLQEGWLGLEYSHSEIDQVKLYALDSYGNRLPCLLAKAMYNSYDFRLTLMTSDDKKLGTYLLETVDLEFLVPYQNIQGFTFVIEGCNMLKP